MKKTKNTFMVEVEDPSGNLKKMIAEAKKNTGMVGKKLLGYVLEKGLSEMGERVKMAVTERGRA